MPQLQSGRHFGLSARHFIDMLNEGSDEKIYAAILVFRNVIRSPEDLREHLSVIYFKDNIPPPVGTAYESGFSIKDVFDGKSDWSEEEIAELKKWLESSNQVKPWLQDQFDEIDSAIKDSPIWTSKWMNDD